MFCLGINAPAWLVALSEFFGRTYPTAFFLALAALLTTLVFHRYFRFAIAVNIAALLLLLGPVAFLCLQLVPLIADFDSGSGDAVLTFLITVVFPVSLPVSAILLARRWRRTVA